MSQTYSDVDSSSDPAGAVAWQEAMAAWPGVAAYKHRTHELLAGARRILDLGCGPGVDLIALGAARSVGVDPSDAMCSSAADRGATIVPGDAHSLPFASEAFDATRADRVFQHLPDPQAGLEELVRVVRRGGRVVIADPDQESLVISVPGVRQTVLDRLKALRRDRGYCNGTLVSRLPSLFPHVGLHDATIDAFPLAIDDPNDAFGLPEWPRLWRQEGGFTDEELNEWDAAMGAGRTGFLYLVTFAVVAAVKG